VPEKSTILVVDFGILRILEAVVLTISLNAEYVLDLISGAMRMSNRLGQVVLEFLEFGRLRINGIHSLHAKAIVLSVKQSYLIVCLLTLLRILHEVVGKLHVC